MKYLCAAYALVLLWSCNGLLSDEGEAARATHVWADAYFNADYMEAKTLSTAESERWLRFAASNTTAHALELLNSQPAEVVSVTEYTVANDTLQVMRIGIRNYLAPTAPDAEERQVAEGSFLVTVVRRDGRWLVRMEGLPRSEKQSHD